MTTDSWQTGSLRLRTCLTINKYVSSENNTYIDQTSFTTWTGTGGSPCTYKICPMANVRRIKLMMTTFELTGPTLHTSTTTAATGSGIGKCNLESMSITTPGFNRWEELEC